ncbi:glycosyltransferase [Candidatus Dojkabacteria bacterium]|nr:glycosyltransferase [Candidatus Dojkabacteria bacterium]
MRGEKNMRPEISVIMAVYREELSQMKESIQSILCQSFKNFEFIIVLDNPKSKKRRELLEQFQELDSRIKIIVNSGNLGLATSLNHALVVSRGKFIARMDADDISLPTRLEEQYREYVRMPECFLFCWAVFIDEKGVTVSNFEPETRKFSSISSSIFSSHFLLHPSLFTSRDLLVSFGYDDSFLRSQDFDLWLRAIAANVTFRVLPKTLLKYRIPCKSSWPARLKRMRNYAKYSIRVMQKNYPHYRRSFEYWKRLGYYMLYYPFLLLASALVKMIPARK